MAWLPPLGSRRFTAASAAAVIAGCGFVAGCAGGGSPDVNDLRNSDAAYYYVGESFDGLKISYVERYQRSDAAIIYGDCKARSDEGCAPPLELEHRLCHGTVTVVIWAKETLAARAADALRPLSRGANGRRPEIAFNHSPRCLP
jgi:hypothetical protein